MHHTPRMLWWLQTLHWTYEMLDLGQAPGTTSGWPPCLAGGALHLCSAKLLMFLHVPFHPSHWTVLNWSSMNHTLGLPCAYHSYQLVRKRRCFLSPACRFLVVWKCIPCHLLIWKSRSGHQNWTCHWMDEQIWHQLLPKSQRRLCKDRQQVGQNVLQSQERASYPVWNRCLLHGEYVWYRFWGWEWNHPGVSGGSFPKKFRDRGCGHSIGGTEQAQSQRNGKDPSAGDPANFCSKILEPGKRLFRHENGMHWCSEIFCRKYKESACCWITVLNCQHFVDPSRIVLIS